jgi:hypothetical protein
MFSSLLDTVNIRTFPYTEAHSSFDVMKAISRPLRLSQEEEIRVTKAIETSVSQKTNT